MLPTRRRDFLRALSALGLSALIDFALPFAGAQTYMFHCHNLEHEDSGMMLGVKVA